MSPEELRELESYLSEVYCGLFALRPNIPGDLAELLDELCALQDKACRMVESKIEEEWNRD